MADEVIKRDGFTNPVGAGVTDDANKDIRMLRINPSNNRLLVDIGATVTIGGVVEVNLDKDNDEVLVYGSTAAGDTSALGPAASTRSPIPLTTGGLAVKTDPTGTSPTSTVPVRLSDGTGFIGSPGAPVRTAQTGELPSGTQEIGSVKQGTAATVSGAWPTKLVDTAGVNVAAVTAAGAVKTDGSAVTQPVTVAQLPAALVTGRLDVNVGAIASALATGDNTVGRVKITDGTTVALVTVGGLLRVESNPTGTQTVAGTVTGNQGTAAAVSSAWPTKLVDSAGVNVASVSAAGALKVDGSGVTQPVSGTVTANIGTTGGLALDATLTARLPAALVTGRLDVNIGAIAAALATGDNTIGRAKITDGTTVALVTAGGLLRVETNPTGTQAVSGTVTGNQGTAAAVSGAWPTKLVDSGGVNVATISAAGALKVDGSAVTQPVSGTVTANIGTTGGLGLDATLLGIKTGTDKIPASPAQEHTAAASPNHAVRLTDGTAFYNAPAAAQLPAALVTGRLDVNIGAIASALATGANTIGAVTGPGAAALALDATVVPRGTTPDVKGHVTNVTPNTETSFGLPGNVKQVFLKVRSANTVNVAFATGKVPPAAGNDYFTISDTKTFNLDKVQIAAGTLFFSSAVASVVVEIVTVV